MPKKVPILLHEYFYCSGIYELQIKESHNVDKWIDLMLSHISMPKLLNLTIIDCDGGYKNAAIILDCSIFNNVKNLKKLKWNHCGTRTIINIDKLPSFLYELDLSNNKINDINLPQMFKKHCIYLKYINLLKNDYKLPIHFFDDKTNAYINHKLCHEIWPYFNHTNYTVKTYFVTLTINENNTQFVSYECEPRSSKIKMNARGLFLEFNDIDCDLSLENKKKE